MDFRAALCAEEDRRAALLVLYSHLSEFDRARQIDRLLEQADKAASPVRLDGLIACRGPLGVVGAMLCMASPGRVMISWPPRTVESAGPAARVEIYQKLLEAGTGFAKSHRCRFMQMLGDDASSELDESLLNAGYFHLTRLAYLRRPMIAGETFAPPDSTVEYIPYTESLHEDFLDVLARSYVKSLDCPELTGIREMCDVFESHKGQGVFDPNRWLLAKRDGRWVGCLLLSTSSDNRMLEISYVAVLPEARGSGLGRELTRQALRVCQQGGFEMLVLAVDTRNAPAVDMYESEGFATWNEPEIYLKVIDPADGRMERR